MKREKPGGKTGGSHPVTKKPAHEWGGKRGAFGIPGYKWDPVGGEVVPRGEGNGSGARKGGPEKDESVLATEKTKKYTTESHLFPAPRSRETSGMGKKRESVEREIK